MFQAFCWKAKVAYFNEIQAVDCAEIEVGTEADNNC